MKLAEFRIEMESYRQDVAKEAERLREPVLVLKRLLELYGRFDAHERLMADQVLSEWVLSDDLAVRFDGLSAVYALKIATAVPAMRRLAERLMKQDSPVARGELDNVERMLLKMELIGDDTQPSLRMQFHVQENSLRVCPETSSGIAKLSKHEADRGEAQEGERLAIEVLPIFGKPSAAVEPRNGALDDPALG
jgi:hypothetical protein